MTTRMSARRFVVFLTAAFLVCGGLSPAVAGPIRVVIGSVSLLRGSVDDSVSIQKFLKDYEATLASGRVDHIVQLYRGGSDDKAKVLRNYFANVIADLEVHLNDIEIDVDGDRALVAFARSDHFTDRESGDAVRKSVALERHLVRDAGVWKIDLAD